MHAMMELTGKGRAYQTSRSYKAWSLPGSQVIYFHVFLSIDPKSAVDNLPAHRALTILHACI